jgi:SAM-dependent methyltransferase
VLSCGVLEHVHDPNGSLEEIRRILREEGRFYVFKLPSRHSYLERIARAGGLYYHGALPDDRVYSRDSAIGLLERHGFEVLVFRRADMLPLTVGGRMPILVARALIAANRVLEGIPGLNLIATDMELIACRR